MLNTGKSDIEARTKCFIEIKTSGQSLKISATSPPSESLYHRNHCVVSFNRILQNLLIEYVNHIESKGRLLFDLASSATGSYKISSSPSGAVKQQSIVDQDGLVWMQLVEVPFNVSSDSRRHFEADIAKASACHAGSNVYLGNPPHCGPYVLVYGYDLDNVDRVAVKISALVEVHTKRQIMSKRILDGRFQRR